MSQEWPGFFYKGCYFLDCLHDVETLKANPIEKWDIRPDDVVIVTFPKSGTYWLLKAISSLFGDLNFLLPKINKTVRLSVLCENTDNEQGPYAEFVKTVKTSLHEMPSLARLLYDHSPSQFLPASWKEGDRRCKFIYIARNPKDVCVSYYYHFREAFLVDMNLNWDEWVKAFVEGKVWYGPWLDHVSGWKRYGPDDNVLFVTYEEMKIDMKSVLAKVADFLDRPKTDDEIERVVKSCEFSEMRSGEEFYREYSMAGGEDCLSEGSRHMRRGRVGDWKNHFTVAQNEFFDQAITDKLEKLGIKFVYQM